MKIFIYWNYKDNDSKKIYQFIKQSTFIENLKKEHEVVVYRKFQDFELDITLMKDLQESDVVLFFTHGEKDSVLKFRYNNELLKDRFTFINLENANILGGKKILAFCCRSAGELGKYCVEPDVNCIFYIGFIDDLIYSDQFSENFKNTVYKTYSSAFEKTLQDCYKYKWSASQFVSMLRKNIVDMQTAEILLSKDRRLGSFASITFHRKTADSLVVLGKSQELVFA